MEKNIRFVWKQVPEDFNVFNNEHIKVLKEQIEAQNILIQKLQIENKKLKMGIIKPKLQEILDYK